MRSTLTREIAWAASTDAGNRSMRQAGRNCWNADDWIAATQEFNRIWPFIDDHGQSYPGRTMDDLGFPISPA